MSNAGNHGRTAAFQRVCLCGPLPATGADPDARQLLLATPAQRWAVALTATETEQLLDVLNGVALLLEAEQLLNPSGASSQACTGCPYAG